MTAEQEDYIRYRLGRARATLEEAKVLLDAGHLHGAVNRLYYACFHAVCALLFTEGKCASKHAGVRAFFDRGWVKPGRVPVEMGRFYRRVFRDRQKADYGGPVRFDAHEVRLWFGQASAFVAELAQLATRPAAAENPPDS
jgi:uncharacterized protein (UPF0332 family)